MGPCPPRVTSYPAWRHTPLPRGPLAHRATVAPTTGSCILGLEPALLCYFSTIIIWHMSCASVNIIITLFSAIKNRTMKRTFVIYYFSALIRKKWNLFIRLKHVNTGFDNSKVMSLFWKTMNIQVNQKCLKIPNCRHCWMNSSNAWRIN